MDPAVSLVDDTGQAAMFLGMSNNFKQINDRKKRHKNVFRCDIL